MMEMATRRFHDAMEQARYSLGVKKLGERYLDATRIVHEDRPWLTLYQESVIDGASQCVSPAPGADYRVLAAALTLAR
jgi:hypothetical protein